MKNQNAELITALIVLTQRGSISWRMTDTRLPEEILDGDFVDGYVYESEVHEKRVLIFRFGSKYLDENDQLKKDYSFRLVVMGKDGFYEMKFDDKWTLPDLYNIVNEKCSSVSQWINEVVEFI